VKPSCLLILLCLASCPPDTVLAYRPPWKETILDGISWTESRGRDHLVGGYGERGRYQVRCVALADYNRRRGTEYTLDDLTDPDLCRAVAEERLDWLEWRYRDVPQPLRDALIISAYNTGHGRADRLEVSWQYVESVSAGTWERVSGYVVRRGRKFATLAYNL
jgi:hypothetical protein